METSFANQIHLERTGNPAYKQLQFKDVLEEMKNSPCYENELEKINWLTNDDFCVLGFKLKKWFKELIERHDSTTVMGYNGEKWTLYYLERGLAHTIKACSEDKRISIDFVPAFVFELDGEKVYACPKAAPLVPEKIRHTMFFIAHPVEEKRLLWNKQNLKIVFRLLKALRDKLGLRRLKTYFLTTIFLWKVSEEDDSYWHNHVDDLLVEVSEQSNLN